MAKASGKQRSSYRETDRFTKYINALSRNTEIRVTSLYTAKPGEDTDKLFSNQAECSQLPAPFM
jgi:hypothetical protein